MYKANVNQTWYLTLEVIFPVSNSDVSSYLHVQSGLCSLFSNPCLIREPLKSRILTVLSIFANKLKKSYPLIAHLRTELEGKRSYTGQTQPT